MTQKVIIGMGSNLAEPILQMTVAKAELCNISSFKNFRMSSLYQTKPVGPQDQPDFINAVGIFDTELSPEEVLNILQALEQKHQRIREIHWGPRTLDLDILFFGEQQINNERLIVPHIEFEYRVFTVIPLLELEPNFIFKGTPLKELVTKLPIDDLNALKKLSNS